MKFPHVGQLVRTPDGLACVLRVGPSRIVVKMASDKQGPNRYFTRKQIKKCVFDRQPSTMTFGELICSLKTS